MMPGLWVSQAMCVATELGIPDELGAGPQSADAIAPAISPPSRPNSTPDPAKHRTGKHRPNASISCSHKLIDNQCCNDR